MTPTFRAAFRSIARCKCRAVIVLTFTCLGLSYSAPATADGPRLTLLKDIYPGAMSGSPGMNVSAPESAVLKGVLYFPARTGNNGFELWKTDGSAAGTAMVKTINPGLTGSDPRGLTTFNGMVLFVADDGTSGAELWKTDGTPLGTVLVKDINPGAGSAFDLTNIQFTVSNGVVFFAADDGLRGRELWKTDGTFAGTVIVRDISPTGSSMSIGLVDSLTDVNGTLFFGASDGSSGRELWKSDGTSLGTVQVMNIAPGSTSSSPAVIVNFNGIALFHATNGAQTGLWRSDGTTAGTQFIKALLDQGRPFVAGNIMYMLASEEATGQEELWKSDGTTDGTVLVKEIAPGPQGSWPGGFIAVNGVVFFSADDLTNGRELWKTDGTPAGTVIVQDINPGGGSALSSQPGRIFDLNGTLVFDAFVSGEGTELWRSDGSAAGTVRISNFSGSGAVRVLLGILGGSVIFSGNDGSIGDELWKTVRTESDFDGEGKADVVVYRPGAGQWWIKRSFGNFASSIMVPWGISTDLPAPADFDGDGKVDPTVFRPNANGYGVWFVRRSATHYADGYSVLWGAPGDVPVPGYYDFDRFADPAVLRPSTFQWFVNRSSTGYTSGFVIHWGTTGDVPVPADFDGDGRTDIAIFRPSTGQWFIKRSDTDFASVMIVQWGLPGDLPVPADFDGDGKADPAIYRPSVGHWFVKPSSSAVTLSLQWGSPVAGHQPVPADFDGDGRADPAVYQPNTGQWYLLRSSAAYTAYTLVQWGNQAAGDVPVRER
jgi:ELWxxDGT repeat protein